jgi:hypothetical protein
LAIFFAVSLAIFFAVSLAVSLELSSGMAAMLAFWGGDCKERALF